MLAPLALVVGLAGATPARADRGTDNIAAYARARAADGDGKVEQAAAAFAAALAAAPDNVTIAKRAYREALEAGDDALIDGAVATLDRAGETPPDAVLLVYARAVRARDRVATQAALAKIEAGPLAFLSGLLHAWDACDTGGDPFAALDQIRINPVAARYIVENRVLLLIAKGRVDEALAALQAIPATGQAAIDLRINAASLLAATGQKDQAREFLTGDDPTIVALRAMLDKGKGLDKSKGATSSAAFGVSRLFAHLDTDLLEGVPSPLTIALARAAIRLDPANDRARLLLAQSLAERRRVDHALATLDTVKPASAFYRASLQQRVAILSNAGRSADALTAGTLLSAQKDATATDAAQLGDLLVDNDRFDDAVKAFQLAMARAGEAPSWSLYLQIGAAYDQAGRWPEARAALEKAVTLAPDSALALNYFGYARMEHGEDVAASVTMLEKARLLDPKAPSITDSLAWAYFRSGDAGRALPLLEIAVSKEPANGTISEHLGDAYWSLGRRFEARNAWRAAAIVADPEEAARLARKIADGAPTAP